MSIRPTYTAEAIRVLLSLHEPPYIYKVCFTEKPQITMSVRGDSQEQMMQELREAELTIFGSTRIDPVEMFATALTGEAHPDTPRKRGRPKVKTAGSTAQTSY
jgi:hypothetical protein